ncbi:MAG: carbohydrate kinase family protein [Candidatus Komeilibacteria bacterium]|jgi:sugar/nucleoside kinase (ribokinase family)|nr:carbohydrate kinase family protein [Candidatus Komeilibacteria bacterium]MBT4447733.1 carbohydrate kinase family protein [Candidatus Komeilibacteria bacterium]
MLKNKITTIGGATRDIMFYTDDMVIIDNKADLLRQKLIGFEYGAKLYSKDVHFVFGGGGMNAAVSLASLGIKTQAILSLGDDLVAKEMIDYLKSRKVSTKLLQIQKNLKTGTSSIINVGKFKEHVIFAYRGANNKIELSQSVIKKINTPWVYLTSLSGNFKPGLNRLFDHCEKKGCQIAWNPGTNQLKLGLKGLAKYMKRTAVFDVNRDEALELVMSVKGKDTKDNIRNILKFLHQYGQRLTVITDGPKGAYMYDGKKMYFKAALKRKGINTTGAGDSFGSGLTAGLIKYNWDLEKSLKLGVLNSNSVIMKIGAQEGLLTAKDLKKYNL